MYSRVDRVEWRWCMDEVDELRELASGVGQVAYDVYEYFENDLFEKAYESTLHNAAGLLVNFGSCKLKRRTITA